MGPIERDSLWCEDVSISVVMDKKDTNQDSQFLVTIQTFPNDSSMLS
jgi:hypothetical protein